MACAMPHIRSEFVTNMQHFIMFRSWNKLSDSQTRT